MIQLWEFHKSKLYWFPLREVDDATSDANLAALREGTPHGWFCASRAKPEHDPCEVTPVLFRMARDKGEDYLTAVFPCEPAQYTGYSMSCYAHVGQHGSCSHGWYRTTRAAKPEEYADLQRELEAAPYHYRLKIFKRMTSGHRRAFVDEQRRVNRVADKVS